MSSKKLTDGQCNRVRRLYSASLYSARELAELFHVSELEIFRILNRKRKTT